MKNEEWFCNCEERWKLRSASQSQCIRCGATAPWYTPPISAPGASLMAYQRRIALEANSERA